MRGEVQRPGLVAPGYDGYGSGLRGRLQRKCHDIMVEFHRRTVRFLGRRLRGGRFSGVRPAGRAAGVGRVGGGQPARCRSRPAAVHLVQRALDHAAGEVIDLDLVPQLPGTGSTADSAAARPVRVDGRRVARRQRETSQALVQGRSRLAGSRRQAHELGDCCSPPDPSGTIPPCSSVGSRRNISPRPQQRYPRAGGLACTPGRVDNDKNQFLSCVSAGQKARSERRRRPRQPSALSSAVPCVG